MSPAGRADLESYLRAMPHPTPLRHGWYRLLATCRSAGKRVAKTAGALGWRRGRAIDRLGLRRAEAPGLAQVSHCSRRVFRITALGPETLSGLGRLALRDALGPGTSQATIRRGRPPKVNSSAHAGASSPGRSVTSATSSKAIPDDRLVPEEGVLDPGLLMGARPSTVAVRWSSPS